MNTEINEDKIINVNYNNKDKIIDETGKNLQNKEINDFNEYYPIKDIKMNEYTVLSVACTVGNKNIIESLINTNLYDINRKIGEYQLTPLMILICNENYECIKFLIENNAD
eukprot:jgi/Orpsp1_1/1175655/evm.model.c7180000054717.1